MVSKGLENSALSALKTRRRKNNEESIEHVPRLKRSPLGTDELTIFSPRFQGGWCWDVLLSGQRGGDGRVWRLWRDVDGMTEKNKHNEQVTHQNIETRGSVISRI